MTSAAAPMPRRRRWPWIVGGAVAAIGLVFAWASIPSSMQPLDDEIARLRAAGHPTTCAEAIGENPPDAENGYVDVEAARVALETDCGVMSAWTVTGPWDSNADEHWPTSQPPERIEELRAFLRRAQPFFDRVDAGIAKPQFHGTVTFDAGGLPSTQWVGTLQWTQMLLVARGEAGATAEDRLAAMVSQARLGRRVEPTSLIGLMVGLAISAGPVHQARRAAEDGSIRAADLRRALEPLLRESNLPRLPAAARSEAAWVATAFRAARDGTTRQLAPRPPVWRRVARRVESLVRRKTYVEFEDLHPDEAAEVVRLWSDVATVDTSSCAGMQASIDEIISQHPPDPSGTVRVMHPIVMRLVRVEAAIALARVALAVAERHESSGAWPSSAGDLRDAFQDGVPPDPFTGDAFVIEVVGDTVRVRSGGILPGTSAPDDATLREHGLLWEFRR